DGGRDLFALPWSIRGTGGQRIRIVVRGARCECEATGRRAPSAGPLAVGNAGKQLGGGPNVRLSAQSLKCFESLLEVSFGAIAIVDAGQQVAHRAMAPCHFIGVLGCGKYRNALGDVLPGLGDPAGSDFYLAGESLNQSCNEQGLGLLLFQSAL